MKPIKLFLILLSTNLSYGQFNTATINHNNIAADVTDAGILFNYPSSTEAGYEFPKGSGKHLLYSAGFWLGGKDLSGQLRTSVTHFTPNLDIFPGPYSSTGDYGSAGYSSAYGNSIWFVSKNEIDDHILNFGQIGYVTPNSILSWPGNGDISIGVSDILAPFIDLNGNNIYEPSLGEYPNIRGDMATYIIMNDDAQTHSGTITPALEIELHLMVYQFSTSNYLNDITFINTRIFNRGNESYSNFKCSLFSDGDVGGYDDDYFGSDSTLNMMYTYNGDSNDLTTLVSGYGLNPPAVGIMSLSHQAEGLGYFTNAGTYPYADPINSVEYWNLMSNKWSDGSQWLYGGAGHIGSSGVTGLASNFMYNGDPLISNEWSEASNDLLGTDNPVGDRRMFMNLPGFNLNSGDQVCLDFCVVQGQDNGLFASVSDLKVTASVVQSFFDSAQFECNQIVMGLSELHDKKSRIYPNPSRGIINIELVDSKETKTIKVYDSAGQKVSLISNNSNQLQVSLESGIYYVQIWHEDGQIEVKKIIILTK
jgi:hypothetical protein